MPLYQYRNLDTGKIEEHIRTIERRDCVEPHLKRITVPVRVGYVGALLEEGTPEREAPRGFRAVEEGGMNHREIARQVGFSVDEIKRVWNM